MAWLFRGLWKGTVSATMLWSLYGSVQFGVYSKLRGEGGGDSGGSRDDVQEGGSSGGIGMLTSSSSSTTSNSTTSSITTATGRARQWLWDGFAGAGEYRHIYINKHVLRCIILYHI